MLKFFFHRNSLMVKLTYAVGMILTLTFFTYRPKTLTSVQSFFLIFFLLQLLFAEVCKNYPWYSKDSVGPGIRLQFQKAIIPFSYFWMIIGIDLWIYPSTVLLIILNTLSLPITIVAFILIGLHKKDKDPSPPNLLSGKDGEGIKTTS